MTAIATTVGGNAQAPGSQAAGETPATLVLRWPCDDVGGSLAETKAHRVAIPQGGVEYEVGGVKADGGTSVAVDGATGTFRGAHNDTFLLDIATIVVYLQFDRLPAEGTNVVFWSKDAKGMAGGVSLEIRTTGGVTRWAGYVKSAGGAAVWFGDSPIGFGTVAVDTGYRVVVSETSPTEWSFYVDDGPAEVTIHTRSGLKTNTADIYLGSSKGTTGFADCVIDGADIYKGSMDQTAVELLTTWQTVSHPSDAVQEFSCIARAGVTQSTEFKNRGTLTTEMNLDDGANYAYDATGTTVSIAMTAYPNPVLTPQNGIRITGPCSNVCVSGGAMFSDYDEDGYTWGQKYPVPNVPAGVLIDPVGPVDDVLIEGVRIHKTWDAFRNGWRSGQPVPTNIKIKGCWVTKCYDEPCENDQQNGWTVEDCLFDGAFAGLSQSNSSGYKGGVSVFDRILLRLEPFPDNRRIGAALNPGTSIVFKLTGTAPPFIVKYSIFAVEQRANGANGDPFIHLKEYWSKVQKSESNIIVSLNGYDYEADFGLGMLTGFTATTDATVWTNAVAAWKTAHPLVARIPGVDT